MTVQHIDLGRLRQPVMPFDFSCYLFDRNPTSSTRKASRLSATDSLIFTAVKEPFASDPTILILVSIVKPCPAALTSPSSCSERPELTAGYRRAVSIWETSFLRRKSRSPWSALEVAKSTPRKPPPKRSVGGDIINAGNNARP